MQLKVQLRSPPSSSGRSCPGHGHAPRPKQPTSARGRAIINENGGGACWFVRAWRRATATGYFHGRDSWFDQRKHRTLYVECGGAAPIDFALPSGERKLVPGLVPYQAKYCVCDPGPVTPDCRATRMDHWCLGQWLGVVPGVNSQIDGDRRLALR